MTRISAVLAGLMLLATVPLPALAADKVPTRPGHCVPTSIKEITSRLEGAPDSGSAIVYANGIYGVSYDMIPEIGHAKVGDKVTLCLVSLPQDCPKGDERGKIYAAFNLRTEEFWELPDAEHMCGGA
jgi:hypothetical protein